MSTTVMVPAGGFVVPLAVTTVMGLFGCSEMGGGCLTKDCGGTSCDVDADCPSPRVCTSDRTLIEGDIPAGCKLPEEIGGAGN